jgi:hypothetical protein
LKGSFFILGESLDGPFATPTVTVTLQAVTHASETFEVVPWHQPYPLSVAHPQTHASNARHRVKQNAQNFKIPMCLIQIKKLN